MTKLSVGIASYEDMKRWTMDVASGKVKPCKDAPRIWFPSLKAAADLFTDDNRQLLRVIAERHPASISELERFSNCMPSNLSSTICRAP